MTTTHITHPSPTAVVSGATSPAHRLLDDAVSRFLTGLETGGVIDDGVFTADVVLDATVPNWRFEVAGEEKVRSQFGAWFADPGHYEELSRRLIPGGEVVELLFCWEERGMPWAAHQVHVLELHHAPGEHAAIARDTMFCGGRWPAPLLAEMEAARG